MADRCWCSRELVEVASASEDGPDSKHFAWVCPIHGENYVWRPCKLAAEPFKRDRMLRGCRLIYGLHRLIANPETCNGCHIPPLVDAVEATLAELDRHRHMHNDLGGSRLSPSVEDDLRAALGGVKP